MLGKQSFVRKHWIDLVAVVIASIALVFSVIANNEAKKQNLYTAVQVQLESCNVTAQTDKFGVSEKDKPQARTKAHHLAKCFSALSFEKSGTIYKTEYVGGYQGFKSCVKVANGPGMYLNQAKSEAVC